ncbi:MAG: hypothetical protein NVS9B8_06890 [Candidatus Limnocylindrales bacterium]
MRRPPALLLTAFVMVVLAACSASAVPGWTYAPAPSLTPAPSGGASAGSPVSPSNPASTAPSTAPSSAGSGSPSGSSTASGGAAALTITAPVGAATAGFDPTILTESTNTAFTIHFDNQDNQAPHNVELKAAGGTAVALGGDTAFFQGPGTRDYAVPALSAGSYTYFCVIHPASMTGTLTIK